MNQSANQSSISVRNIGIFGGSFNPVHCGHLCIAETAACEFELQRIIFIPCKVSPFKTSGEYIEDVHRLEMIRLSIAGHCNFELSRMEIDRGGLSYSYETVREIKNLEPEANLFFIIGTDSLLSLAKWHKIDALLNLCDFVTVERPGLDKRIEEQNLGFSSELSQRLMLKSVSGRLMNISSSEIRQRVSEGRSIKGLVPAAVEEYILRNGLYLQKERVKL